MTINTQYYPVKLKILTPEEEKVLESLLSKIAKTMYKNKIDKYFVIGGRIIINEDLKNLEIQLSKRD